MKDAEKTKEQLLSELAELRKHVAELQDVKKELADLLPQIVFETDARGNFTYVNRHAYEMLGFTPEDVKSGINALDVVVPEDRAIIADNIAKALSGQVVEHPRNDFTILRKDGSTFQALIWPYLIIRDNKPAGLRGVCVDITEIKQAQEALRQSEEKLRLTFEAIEDSIILIDPEGRVLDANEAAVRLAGFKNKLQVIGINAFDIISPKDRERVMKAFKERLAGRPQRNTECAIKPKRGKKDILVDITASPLRDEAGHSIGYIAVLRDITERKHILDALRESEEKLRLTFESIKEDVSISDLEGHIVMVNEAGLRMSGYDQREELIGRNGIEFIAEKDRERAVADMSRQLQESRGSAFSYCTLTDKNGNEYYGEISATMLPDANGNPVGFIAVVRDITERKLMDQALHESGEKLQLTLESVEDGIIVIDNDGNVVDANEATVRMSGYGHKEDIIGRNAFEWIAPKDRSLVMDDLKDRLEGRPKEKMEYSVHPQNDRDIEVELTASTLRDEEGKPTGYIAVLRDVTKRKEAEEKLRENEKKYKDLVEQEKDVIFSIDELGYITSINSAVTMWGYAPEEIIGKHYSVFLPQTLFDKLVSELSKPLMDNGETVAEAVGLDKEGNWRPLEFSAMLIMKDGKFAGVRGIVRDIRERKRAEEALKQRNRELATLNKIAEAVSHPLGLNKVLRTALDSVLETMDFTGGCIWLLDKDSSELGLVSSRGPKGMPIGVATIQDAFKTGDVTTVIHHSENQSGQATKARAIKASEGKAIISIPLKSKGETLGVLGVVGAIKTFSPDDIRLLETIGDQIAVAVENARLLDRLNDLSITDELTGLFNRRHFYKVLESETDRTRRYGRCISLAMIDLDGFKKYNDKFGHANGDVILADFAKVLTETLRKTDTAFRYGGDEFIVIFPATNAERAKEVIERISKKWLKRLAVQLPLADIQLGFSAGIAQFPDNAETVDGLVFLTDTALYYAKRGGGQKVMLISDLGTSSLDVLSASTLDQVSALAATVDTKDPYTYGHSKRTAAIAESLGKAIGLGSDELSDLTAAAFLHDIGKVGIADIILTKPGKPKKEEWEAIKKHCAEGAKIVQHVKELMPLAPIILHHHEWYDGTGYPDGLKGEEIPLHARIISVADAYDTMTAQRAYHEGVSPQKALEELERCSGTQFDPKLIEALRRITGNGSAEQ